MDKYKLFLDDERIPFNTWTYTKNSIYLEKDWVIVRTYLAFANEIERRWNETNSIPEIISFDHDLGDEHYGYLHGDIPYDEFKEKTGYHCAKWLVDFCIDNNIPLPKFIVHSMNPVGADNIYNYLLNYKKHEKF